MNEIQLYNANCVEILKTIPDSSIDLILTDLPYEETGNSWDKNFPLRMVCEEFERVITDSGAIVLTGTFKFGMQLYNIMPHLYKYDWVWEKDSGTNAPNVNLQPFRVHEYVYVFGKGRVTNGTRTPMKYNPQKTKGKPYNQMSGNISTNWKGSLKNIQTVNEDGSRYPKTIQKFVRDKGGLHPTQKPLAMMKYFIRTYSNNNDLVLDCCMGSGTTGVACKQLNRKFIGIELNKDYYELAKFRIENDNGNDRVISDLYNKPRIYRENRLF